MEKRSRNILFYLSLGAFILISIGVTLYAQGYVYSFAEGKIVKTGSIRVSAQTSGKVLFDNKTQSSLSGLSDVFEKGRLRPRDYQIKITKDGFYDWGKTATVRAGELTNFPSVYLVTKTPKIEIASVSDELESLAEVIDPNSGTFETISQTLAVEPKAVKKVERLGGVDIVLIKTARGGILYKLTGDNLEVMESGVDDFVINKRRDRIAWRSADQVGVIWLKDTSYQPIHLAGDEEIILETSSEIDALDWFKTDDHLFVKAGNNIFFVELDGRSNRNVYTVFTEANIDEIKSQPDGRLLIKFSDKYIYLEI